MLLVSLPAGAESKETCDDVHAMMKTVEENRRKTGAAMEKVMAKHPEPSSNRSSSIAPLQKAQRANDAKTRELSEKLRKMECPPVIDEKPAW